MRTARRAILCDWAIPRFARTASSRALRAWRRSRSACACAAPHERHSLEYFVAQVVPAIQHRLAQPPVGGEGMPRQRRIVDGQVPVHAVLADDALRKPPAGLGGERYAV